MTITETAGRVATRYVTANDGDVFTARRMAGTERTMWFDRMVANTVQIARIFGEDMDDVESSDELFAAVVVILDDLCETGW